MMNVKRLIKLDDLLTGLLNTGVTDDEKASILRTQAIVNRKMEAGLKARDEGLYPNLDDDDE